MSRYDNDDVIDANEDDCKVKGSKKDMRRQVVPVVVTLLSLGILGYILVKFIWPMLEALVGAMFAVLILLLVLLLTGAITAKTANITWEYMLDYKDFLKSEFWRGYRMGKERYAKQAEA